MVTSTKKMTPQHSLKVCPIAKVADLLSDSWTMLIIRDLLIKPSRFCELERSLIGISSRTLTLKLKSLVKEDIIKNDDNSYYYSITKQGKNLGKIIDEMSSYGKRWM